MTLSLLPSAPALTVAWLKTQTDLAAIHGGRVGTKLNATLPAIRVQRIGGMSPDVYEDQPLMQFECWAADEGTADRLVRTLVAALPSFRDATNADGKVWTYSIESGPLWMPDDPQLSTNARYLLTARLITTTPVGAPNG